jgi:hypothetical protein
MQLIKILLIICKNFLIYLKIDNVKQISPIYTYWGVFTMVCFAYKLVISHTTETAKNQQTNSINGN